MFKTDLKWMILHVRTACEAECLLKCQDVGFKIQTCYDRSSCDDSTQNVTDGGGVENSNLFIS